MDSCAPWRGGGRGWTYALLGGEGVGVGLMRSLAGRGMGFDSCAPWREEGWGLTHALLRERVAVGLMRSLAGRG